MKPGRELDALVAEKVMGWKWDEASAWSPSGSKYARDYPNMNGDSWWWLPEYSTDIAAAMKVLTHVMKSYRKKISIETYEGEAWSIKPCGTSSRSLPHAICLAALKALGAI